MLGIAPKFGLVFQWNREKEARKRNQTTLLGCALLQLRKPK